MLNIRGWLAPPVFPDDKIKTHRAKMLNFSLITILMLAPMIIIGDLLGGKTPLTVWITNVFSFSFCLVLRSLMYRGRVLLASIGLIIMAFVLVTAASAELGTIRTPTTAMYLLIVIIGGLLFDLRGMVITIAMSSLLIGGLIVAENDDILPRPDYSVTITQWISYTVIFAWTGSLTFISLQTMRNALKRADRELIDRKAAEDALIKSENLLNETQHITKAGGWEYDIAAGKIIWTQEVYRIFGVTPEEYEPNDRNPDIEFYTREDMAIIQHAFKGAVEDGNPYDLELRIRNKSGENMWVRIIGKPERKGGKIVRIYGNIVDITQRKHAEEELMANKEYLRTIIETEPECVKIVAADGKLVSMNRAGLDMIECENGEQVIGASIYDLIAPEYVDAWYNFHESICRANKGELRFVMISLKGNRHWMESHAAPIRNPTDGTIMQLAVTRDITNQKRAEEALQAEKDNLVRIFEAMIDGIFIVDQKNNIQYVNQMLIKDFGPYRGRKGYDYFHDRRDGYPSCRNMDVFAGKTVRCEWHSSKNGRTYDLIGTPLLNPDGTIYELEIFRDITERKKAQKQIEASLKEKEILLREIHHRVKNNLQIISSLLELQSTSIKEQKYLEMFRDSQDRINSIALIHEKLYMSKDLAEIDFKEYIKDLSTKLYHTYKGKGGRIKLTLNIDNISLGIDQAMPCGLIINELITNSFRHAFPQDRVGEIKISLRIDEKMVELVAGDNGIGIPDYIDFRNTESLGLHLVMLLIDQLHGMIELDRSGGTEFKIIFKGEK